MVEEVDNSRSEKPATYKKKGQNWMLMAVMLLAAVLLIGIVMDLFKARNTVVDEEGPQPVGAQPTVGLQENDFAKQVEMQKRRAKDKVGEDQKEKMMADLKRQLAEMAKKSQQPQNPISAVTSMPGVRTPAEEAYDSWMQEEKMRALRSYSASKYSLSDGAPETDSVTATEGGRAANPATMNPADLIKEVMDLQGNNKNVGRTNTRRVAYPRGAEPDNDSNSSQQGAVVGGTCAIAPMACGSGAHVPVGTVIHATMNQKVMSDYAGFYTAIVSRDVYDLRQRLIVIPKGSKIVGEVKRVTNVNEAIQNRLALTNRWIVRPDGSKVSFAKISSTTDVEGVNAVKDQTNYHWGWRAFGVVSYALISSETSYQGTGANSDGTFEGRVGEGLRDVTSPIAEKFINLVPTVIIRAGEPIKLMLYDDIKIEPWRHI